MKMPYLLPQAPYPSHANLVVMDNALGEGLVQHLLIPLLQALRLGNFLIRGVAVEDVVISFTWGTGPDVPCHIPAGHTQLRWKQGAKPSLPSRSNGEAQAPKQGQK